MKVILVIAFIVLCFILDKYPNLCAIFLGGLASFGSMAFVSVVCIKMLKNEIPTMFFIIYIILFIVSLILVCIYLKFTINLLYYWINKEKILKYGKIERGVIKKIKVYRDPEFNNEVDAYRLIVELNGKEIKSLFFKKNINIKVEYVKHYQFIKINDSKDDIKTINENKYESEEHALYEVGDEIDVITYKGRKYVKLYNMQ